VKPSEDNKPPVAGSAGKIIVEKRTGNVGAGEAVGGNQKDTVLKEEGIAENAKAAIQTRASNIIVTTLPDTGGINTSHSAGQAEKQVNVTATNEQSVPGKKSRIIVTTLPDTTNGGASGPENPGISAGVAEAAGNHELEGVTLIDMSLQISKLYEGTVVCVLNDSADFSDIASVNSRGEFLLYGFLSYQLTLPNRSSGIISQTVFINDKMQIIETINKRVRNGRYVYSSNSKEKASNRAILKIIPNTANFVLFSTIYFDRSKATLAVDGVAELDKLVEYLGKNQKTVVYLVGHADVSGSMSPNKKLADNRAGATIEYLVSKGIKRERITGKGYAETKPIYELLEPTAINEENRRRRRLDIFIKGN